MDLRVANKSAHFSRAAGFGVYTLNKGLPQFSSTVFIHTVRGPSPFHSKIHLSSPFKEDAIKDDAVRACPGSLSYKKGPYLGPWLKSGKDCACFVQ